MMKDKDIRIIQASIRNALNKPGLPKEVSRLILSELLNEFTQEADRVINEQLSVKEGG